MVKTKTLSALAALSFVSVQGLNLNVDSTGQVNPPPELEENAKSASDSIISTASTIAGGMVSYYKGNESGQVPGLLPSPYFWWEGGALFDSLIQYWYLTGDSQYNELVSQALQFQQGPDHDFLPTNQTNAEGNDDQSTWALAAMSAAESKFPEAAHGAPWLSLADAVFNDQVARWDVQSCGGGLRWQIFAFNNGYNFKSSIANGYFFQLAARLARYTGNTTYSDWASKAFDWSTEVGYVNGAWNVYDGADSTTNCTAVNAVQFSNNAGTYITGVAHMYNVTSGNSTWKTALDGLLNRTLNVFFPDGIANEVACESNGDCTTDMNAFKGLLGHWLVDTIQMAPYTSDLIMPKLTSSAQAAASACNGAVCPLTWNGVLSESTSSGLGEQLSALSFVQGLLVNDAATSVAGNETSTSSGSSNGASTSTGSSIGTHTPTASSSGSPAQSANAGGIVRVGTSGPMVAAGLGSVAWLIM